MFIFIFIVIFVSVIRYMKEKKFIKLIEESFLQSKYYDKTKYEYLRIRSIMIKDNPSFDNLSALNQLEYCSTILFMVKESTSKDINKLKLYNNKKNKVYEYAIDEGYVEPNIVSIEDKGNTIKLLT